MKSMCQQMIRHIRICIILVKTKMVISKEVWLVPNDRALLMWKIYLEQGGRDAYTGLPLESSQWIWNMFVVINNKDGGKPGKEEWEQRENNEI